jgi:hypothetical protein
VGKVTLNLSNYIGSKDVDNERANIKNVSNLVERRPSLQGDALKWPGSWLIYKIQVVPLDSGPVDFSLKRKLTGIEEEPSAINEESGYSQENSSIEGRVEEVNSAFNEKFEKAASEFHALKEAQAALKEAQSKFRPEEGSENWRMVVLLKLKKI